MSMAARGRVVPSGKTVVEVLNLYNYEDWSIQVETYFIAEGLWDVVDDATAAESTPDPADLNWRMKNAKALHTIQNSCAIDVFGFIRLIRTAKDAWQTLAKRLKPKNGTVARYIAGSGSMTAPMVPGDMINLEALNQNNYKDWSLSVKTYLVAENLWDVVKAGKGEAEILAWKKINACALHVITVFCGENAASYISGIEKARVSWNTLAKEFQPTLEDPDGTAEEEVAGKVSQQRSDYETFFNNVCGGEWDLVKRFIEQNPHAVRAKERHLLKKKTKEKVTGHRGMTAFQRAVCQEDLDGVNKLLRVMEMEDLEILDDAGHTALSLAIENPDTDRTTEILECIVKKNRGLLLRVVDASANAIPLLHALRLDKPKMAYYLYLETQFEKLNYNRRDLAELVSTSLRFKHFDIALDLLHHFKDLHDLVIAQDNSGGCPLNELANTRGGFRNDSQLGIWKRLVYKCISIPGFAPISHDPQSEENDQGSREDLDVCIDLQSEENDQGSREHLDVCIDLQSEENEQGNRKNHDVGIENPKHLMIPSRVSRVGPLLAYIRYLYGIEEVARVKLHHVRTREILNIMCSGLEKRNQTKHKFVEKAIFQAVERGNAPFVKEMLARNWRDRTGWFLAITNEHDKTIFQFAAEHRQQKILGMLERYFAKQEIKETVARKDEFGNNMLHVVAKLPPLTHIGQIRGAALQWQNEIRWFKKVEHMSSPNDLNCLNSDLRTPHEVFTMDHKELVKEGQSEMKEIANSSSFVGALIITIMFAAAVTVPGGIKGDTGIPIYLDTPAFHLFIFAVIISLCCSTTSVLASFGIITSRFAEEDFLISLPRKMIFSLLTLFVSIAGMMVAFSTAIFIMIPEKQSIVIPSIVLACVPVASFLWMEGKLLIEVINSTYNFGVF